MTAEFKPLTKENVAEVLGFSLRTVENWVNDGTLIAPRKLGNRVYWHPSAFYEWLDLTLSAPENAVTTDLPSSHQTSQDVPKTRSKPARSTPGENENLRMRDQAKLKALMD